MKSARLIVVDDHGGMLRAVRRILEGPHQIFTFTSPREALAAATGIRPDLAIVDIRMQEMDGFGLLRELKSVLPDLDVILMTGSVTELDQKMIRAIHEEAFYFIQKPFDTELLKTLVDRCLQQRRLRESNLAHVRRLEEELADARAFQRSLLPPESAVVAGIPVACRLIPCTELAGDIYDYAPCGAGRAALLVADVSGHGGSAAMMTALVKSAFHAALAEGVEPERVEPERVAAAIVGALRPFGAERYVTMICACLEPEARTLTYVNAGHPAGLLWTPAAPGHLDGPAGRLAPTGPILSPVLAGAVWKPRRMEVPPGARLLLFTDGVIESTSGVQEYGDDGLHRAITRRSEGGSALLDDILTDLLTLRAGHPQTDDITLVTAAL